MSLPTSEAPRPPSVETDDLGAYLQHVVRVQASDLFMTVGAPPAVKVEGRMVSLGSVPLPRGAVKRLAYSVMSPTQVRDFERDLECDLAYSVDGLGRFRFNVYVQRGEVSLVARHVRSHIPTLPELRLPPVVERLAMLRQGLVLVVGSAGSGKSTTLAAMLEHRNQRAPGHILTVEDPIEFVHEHRKCIIDQREVGLDTRSFGDALRHALREAPDVIMIGEIRDQETMQHALHYAETGHLCVSTLHANNANQAIERIINFFPDAARKQVLMDLSLNLKGVLAQRLVQTGNGPRVPATEVMLLTAYVSELIQKGEADELKSVIAKSVEVGMHSFDQSLFELYQRDEIGLETALEHADSKTDLSLRIRLAAGTQDETNERLTNLRRRRIG
ncbi:PilT/PilU family type 4a pilus ATPase [Ramlibacter sp. AW1]|uniref:PilT/PilU family type 4a pilus ATPase n=1 Tax=Ramlibacter aurantiacus TaxID=2801330 RepID=A0A936ZNA0_9BURK|nr:PilT/PilU family type 4a pilus ATPase [Ramlibacter aurantiacus]MBL0420445.1 PilT/PilU family type 4a pilus ATPase [Ramlibacter aurantiacus]